MFELILKDGVSLESFISRHGMANSEILDISNGRLTVENVGIDFSKSELVEVCKAR